MEIKKVVNIWQLLIVVLLMTVVSSCGNNKSSEEMIAGSGNKTWRASKELNSAGKKERLSSDEKQETMQFYSDGRFALGGGGSLETGRWAYDEGAKRLSLTPENQDQAMTFEVLKLTDNEMNLRAGDGSEMRMKAE